MEIQYKKTSELVPYANNTRTHSPDQVKQIASSIKEFGFTNPVLIDEDGGIIAGHGRVMAANLIKMDEVPTITLSGLTDAQIKAYIIADNKLALNAGWDEELLKIELEALAELDFDLGLIGFDDDELEALGVGESDIRLDDSKADDVPDVVEDPVIRRGDMIELGSDYQHKVLCGDSTNMSDVMRVMDGTLADQLVTDPPYNVDYTGKTKDSLKIDNDKMEDDAFRKFLTDAFRAADSVMKPGAVFYIWHADSEGYNFRGSCKDVGWKVRQNLIWEKNSMVMGRQDYHWQHEPCLYGWKDGAGHLWNSDRKQTTILHFDRPTRNDIHPTMKPVALIEYNITNNTKGKDTVLDLFLGSGSTLISAENTGRICRGLELDPKYVQVIIQRYVDYTLNQMIKINGEEVDWEEYKNSKGGGEMTTQIDTKKIMTLSSLLFTRDEIEILLKDDADITDFDEACIKGDLLGQYEFRKALFSEVKKGNANAMIQWGAVRKAIEQSASRK